MQPRIVYHFAWGPMRSKPCLRGEAADRLLQALYERADELPVEIEEVRVLPDRVYLAVAAPPTLSPHRIVCQLKAHTSRCLRHEFQEMNRIPTLWTRAYFVLAGETHTADEVLAAYQASLPPRRRPGRPRMDAERD